MVTTLKWLKKEFSMLYLQVFCPFVMFLQREREVTGILRVPVQPQARGPIVLFWGTVAAFWDKKDFEAGFS